MYSPETFLPEMALIANEALREFVAECLRQAPGYFYLMPASTTGKYHPEYSLGEGGLVRHTKAAVKLAVDLLSLEQNQHLDKDVIISALILHDTVKKGNNSTGYTTHDHPLHASELVGSVAKSRKYNALKTQVVEIQCLIESHMGQWNTGRGKNDPVLPKPETESEKFVHTCDYLASRRYLTCEVS